MVYKVHLDDRGIVTGPHFRRERAKNFSLKLHLLSPGLRLLLLPTVAKNLAVCTIHSKKMKETISEAYCPTDTTLSDSVIQNLFT
jgi:hypothetical protein